MEWRGGGKGVVKWKFHERGGEKIVGGCDSQRN